jgi:murein DD-endopeptidase MepM/ murein hydrolase activator NlpD
MANSKYYYDPKSSQYKRLRFSFWNAVLYGSGILLTAGFILMVLIVCYDQFMVTDLEKTLLRENKALRKHKKILTAQLVDIESALTALNQQDRLVHARLFDIAPSVSDDMFLEKNKANQNLLYSSEDDFQKYIKNLTGTTQTLRHQTVIVNQFFSTQYSLKPEDAVMLQGVPTLKPIEALDQLQLVSGFGIRINPFHKGKYKHPGMDFAAPRGTFIQATAPGKIKRVRVSSLLAGYGNYITIDHGNGFSTLYAHLDDLFVRNGEKVSKGQIIGTVGSSGGSIAPHLHYEIHLNGEQVDPAVFMIEGLSSSEHSQLLSVNSQHNQSLD